MKDIISVRAATAADVDAVVQLFEAYRAFYELPPDAARAQAFVQERLERGDSAILVAVDARGDVVGFVQLYSTFSSLRMGRALVLNDLFVHPAARRKGVARKLMEAARVFAQMSGAVAISLETQRDNAKARALYDSLGWHAEEDFVTYALTLG
jgi:ribosomal protein S18 acetylase RimI-like enzyme